MAMRQLPALFSTDMVKALLDGRKTMTRRTKGLEKVNECPDNWYFQSLVLHASGRFSFAPLNVPTNLIDESCIVIARPQYQVGDQIYVRETWCEPILFDGCEKEFYYKADYLDGIECDYDSRYISGKWKPSIHMPKEAARIWLECTGVRCERLHDITEADAIAEGILNFNNDLQKWVDYCPKNHYSKEELEDGYPFENLPSNSFFTLWESINGIESVRLNPWVFVYEFKRIEKP